jgi:hypothetical protein
MPEKPRSKDGYGQKPFIPPGTQHDVRRKGRLGYIKLLIPELTPENFLHFEGQIVQSDSLGDDFPVGYRQNAIIRRAGKRKG